MYYNDMLAITTIGFLALCKYGACACAWERV